MKKSSIGIIIVLIISLIGNCFSLYTFLHKKNKYKVKTCSTVMASDATNVVVNDVEDIILVPNNMGTFFSNLGKEFTNLEFPTNQLYSWPELNKFATTINSEEFEWCIASSVEQIPVILIHDKNTIEHPLETNNSNISTNSNITTDYKIYRVKGDAKRTELYTKYVADHILPDGNAIFYSFTNQFGDVLNGVYIVCKEITEISKDELKIIYKNKGIQ